jgi:hypothetical protein
MLFYIFYIYIYISNGNDFYRPTIFSGLIFRNFLDFRNIYWGTSTKLTQISYLLSIKLVIHRLIWRLFYGKIYEGSNALYVIIKCFYFCFRAV